MAPLNRFAAFTPEEREIFRILLQNHANTVAEIALLNESRISHYLTQIESLENELKGAE